MKFSWNPDKAISNLKDHKVSFEEAQKVFDDFFALEEYDDAHSSLEEKRFNRVGATGQKILYVVYTARGEAEDVYHLISARNATNEEREVYEQERINSGFGVGS